MTKKERTEQVVRKFNLDFPKKHWEKSIWKKSTSKFGESPNIEGLQGRRTFDYEVYAKNPTYWDEFIPKYQKFILWHYKNSSDPQRVVYVEFNSHWSINEAKIVRLLSNNKVYHIKVPEANGFLHSDFPQTFKKIQEKFKNRYGGGSLW